MGMMEKFAQGQDLSKGMADRLGVNLDAAFDNTSDVGALALRGVAMRCAGCTEHADCAAMQAIHDHFATAPDYCRNGALFDRLMGR